MSMTWTARLLKRRIGSGLLFFVLLCIPYSGLTGCAPALSRQFRAHVKAPIPFKALLEEGGTYKGQKVILGGYILESENKPDGSLLTVLQAPLDYRNEPRSQDLSEGRFLVQTEKFLDPEVYSKDRKLTVGGKMLGVRSLPLGNRSYTYPVIEAEELYLWPKELRYIRPDYPYYYYWPYPWYCYPRYPYPCWAW